MLHVVKSGITMITRKNPVIFVIGCTGTGKSDLGVAIARKYNGEVISADSMQIYKGMDIATNKITEDEMLGVPHHMMSFLEPCTNTYNVHEFREQALKLVQEIRDRGRIPVIVGGTTYYVESLLFDDNFISTDKHETVDCSDLDGLSNEQLHRTLAGIDEESARLVHPNNRARVMRAVLIYRLTGTKKSEHLKRQRLENGGADLGGRLRYSDSLVVSLDASLEVLDERLDNRVEKMQKMGLRRDLEEFYAKYYVEFDTAAYGALQCIGLKEFVPYLQLTPEERQSKNGDKLFALGCVDVKLHTRQYSRKQRNWVKSRLVKRADCRELPSLVMHDTSDKDTFLASGMEVVDEWMQGRDFAVEADPSKENSTDANMTFHCDLCDILISGRDSWNVHISGKKHKGRTSAQKRKQLAENAHR